jgi:predicted ArsR family transcriptional regulator
MKSTRERIMETLLERRRCTINDLAEAVGINPISVRHHIIKLEAEQLVASEEERQGVGRPPRVYFLTEDGFERFPTRYLRLTNRLLDQLKESLPKATVNRLFTQMAEELADDYSVKKGLASMPLEERVGHLQTLLKSEGFSVEWEKEGDQIFIHEISCPYYQVGQNHPEVCVVDETLISNLLAVPAERVSCILNGDHHCTYVVSNNLTNAPQESQ